MPGEHRQDGQLTDAQPDDEHALEHRLDNIANGC